MRSSINLKSLLPQAGSKEIEQRSLFAFLNLGVVESLSSGAMTVSDAVRLIYNAKNCQFARDCFRDKGAERVMSHGIQRPDLFDALPAEEAHREFHRELEIMRGLCLKLLEKKRKAA